MFVEIGLIAIGGFFVSASLTREGHLLVLSSIIFLFSPASCGLCDLDADQLAIENAGLITRNDELCAQFSILLRQSEALQESKVSLKKDIFSIGKRREEKWRAIVEIEDGQREEEEREKDIYYLLFKSIGKDGT